MGPCAEFSDAPLPYAHLFLELGKEITTSLPGLKLVPNTVKWPLSDNTIQRGNVWRKAPKLGSGRGNCTEYGGTAQPKWPRRAMLLILICSSKVSL